MNTAQAAPHGGIDYMHHKSGHRLRAPQKFFEAHYAANRRIKAREHDRVMSWCVSSKGERCGCSKAV